MVFMGTAEMNPTRRKTYAASEVLRIRIRRIDLPDLRRAARLAGLEPEHFIAETVESALASFRASRASCEIPVKWNGSDYKVTALPIDSRAKFSREGIRRALSLAEFLPADAIAKRFGVSKSCVRRIIATERAIGANP